MSNLFCQSVQHLSEQTGVRVYPECNSAATLGSNFKFTEEFNFLCLCYELLQSYS